MKVITTNLLNRFWKNGVTPMKEELKKKLDTSKIIASTKISEAGKVMDGKTASEELAKVNGELADGFYNYNAPVYALSSLISNGHSFWKKAGKTVTFHFSVQGVGTGGYKMVTGLPKALDSVVFPFQTVYGVGNGALTIDSSGNGVLSNVTSRDNSVVYGTYICQ